MAEGRFIAGQPPEGPSMIRTCAFVRSIGVARCRLRTGEVLMIPVVPGLLKHPRARDLAGLLGDARVVRKYTREALKRAPWPVLRQFPHRWLKACMKDANLPRGRRLALQFMLS
jgi:hypothetical protein